jgi:DNA-binding beta-propeller fold protein YncE
MRVSLGDRESEDRSADPTKTLPDDKVTVIDLQASPPNVVATSQVGSGPSGVSINRTGTLALVADRNEGAVSIFAINRKTLTPAGRLQLSDAKSGPSDVTFTPGRPNGACHARRRSQDFDPGDRRRRHCDGA